MSTQQSSPNEHAEEHMPLPAPAGKTALSAMSNPVRMRILGALRVNGEQTVGELSQALGVAPGAISYHLTQLEQANLAEKTAGPKNTADKRKSWWKASQPLTVFDSHAEQQPDEVPDEHTADLYRRTAALSLASAYERYLDEFPNLGDAWADAGSSNDFVLHLTPAQSRALAADLLRVIEKWQRVSEQQLPTAQSPEDPTSSTDSADNTDSTDTAHTDVRDVAVIAQVFRWFA